MLDINSVTPFPANNRASFFPVPAVVYQGSNAPTATADALYTHVPRTNSRLFSLILRGGNAFPVAASINILYNLFFKYYRKGGEEERDKSIDYCDKKLKLKVEFLLWAGSSPLPTT